MAKQISSIELCSKPISGNKKLPGKKRALFLVEPCRGIALTSRMRKMPQGLHPGQV